MRGIKKWIRILPVLLLVMYIGACSSPGNESDTQEVIAEPETILASGAYDSADTAVIVSVDQKSEKIVFWNLIRKRTYTLQYDGVTEFKDKYGTALSAAQLEEGTIADIHFLKEDKRLVSLQNSSDVWEYKDVSRFEVSADRKTIMISDEVYNISDSVIVLSDGKQTEMIEINPQDVLHLSGREQEIFSIVIGKGHGYLRLENEDYFIGGWIEVGQKVIRKIEEDMLLVVPEGTYQVLLSHEGLEGVKEVTILRDQETQLDVGDLKKEDLIKYGNLIFTVEPATAVVSLDGKEIDITRIVKTEYGLHQIMATAEGYDTVVQYIRVNQESANVNIMLDEKTAGGTAGSDTQNTVSGNTVTSPDASRNTTVSQNTVHSQNSSAGNTGTVSGNTSPGNAPVSSSGTGYKVTINAPEGAEIYVDGYYVGIVPASFAKVSGSHVVTVRKTGYLTRSYTIEVDDEAKDTSYSFSDLTSIE